MVGGGLPGRINIFRLMETLCTYVDDSRQSSKDLVLKSPKDTVVATLEPYVPKSLPQRRKIVSRRTMEDIFSPPVWSQYITLTLNEEVPPLSDLVLYRSLKKILGSDSPKFSEEKNSHCKSENRRRINKVT